MLCLTHTKTNLVDMLNSVLSTAQEKICKEKNRQKEILKMKFNKTPKDGS